MEEVQELEAQLQVFETVMQRDIAECVTDMETTFQSTEVDLSGNTLRSTSSKDFFRS